MNLFDQSNHLVRQNKTFAIRCECAFGTVDSVIRYKLVGIAQFL